PDMYAFGL
uniref:Carcinustatin-12 n=1 Tax=Carcinus maenas TaxID=6759 RepID=ALL12_CARMA|nr:RecName: Full=Carcinustatin-12 [Carcinus maenas]